MSASEHDPTARAAAGDDVARHDLLERHLGSLRSYIRVRLGKGLRAKETSLDLTQSVCRQVLQNFDAFDYRGEESFRHWLLRQAENKIRDRKRFWHRVRRDTHREESDQVLTRSGGARELSARVPHDPFTPSRHATGREELERMRAALDDLPPDFRRVIELARLEGLSHQEIAERMGRSPSATRTLLSRALARLATELEPGLADTEAPPPAD